MIELLYELKKILKDELKKILKEHFYLVCFCAIIHILCGLTIDGFTVC